MKYFRPFDHEEFTIFSIEITEKIASIDWFISPVIHDPDGPWMLLGLKPSASRPSFTDIWLIRFDVDFLVWANDVEHVFDPFEDSAHWFSLNLEAFEEFKSILFHQNEHMPLFNKYSGDVFSKIHQKDYGKWGVPKRGQNSPFSPEQIYDRYEIIDQDLGDRNVSLHLNINGTYDGVFFGIEVFNFETLELEAWHGENLVLNKRGVVQFIQILEGAIEKARRAQRKKNLSVFNNATWQELQVEARKSLENNDFKIALSKYKHAFQKLIKDINFGPWFFEPTPIKNDWIKFENKLHKVRAEHHLFDKNKDSYFHLSQIVLELARLFRKENRLDSAQAAYQYGFLLFSDLLQNEIESAILLKEHGIFLLQAGMQDDAFDILSQALEVFKGLVQGHDEPKNLIYQIITTLIPLGDIYVSRGREDLGLQNFAQSLELLTNLGATNDLNVAEAMVRMGYLQLNQGVIDESLKFFEKSYEIFDDHLGEKHPNVVELRDLINTLK